MAGKPGDRLFRVKLRRFFSEPITPERVQVAGSFGIRMVANHFVTMLQSTRVGDAGGAEVRRWAIQLTAALRHGLSQKRYFDMTRLPSEILGIILEHSAASDDPERPNFSTMLSAALVCRDWNSVAESAIRQDVEIGPRGGDRIIALDNWAEPALNRHTRGASNAVRSLYVDNTPTFEITPIPSRVTLERVLEITPILVKLCLVKVKVSMDVWSYSTLKDLKILELANVNCTPATSTPNILFRLASLDCASLVGEGIIPPLLKNSGHTLRMLAIDEPRALEKVLPSVVDNLTSLELFADDMRNRPKIAALLAQGTKLIHCTDTYKAYREVVGSRDLAYLAGSLSAARIVSLSLRSELDWRSEDTPPEMIVSELKDSWALEGFSQLKELRFIDRTPVWGDDLLDLAEAGEEIGIQVDWLYCFQWKSSPARPSQPSKIWRVSAKKRGRDPHSLREGSDSSRLSSAIMPDTSESALEWVAFHASDSRGPTEYGVSAEPLRRFPSTSTWNRLHLAPLLSLVQLFIPPSVAQRHKLRHSIRSVHTS